MLSRLGDAEAPGTQPALGVERVELGNEDRFAATVFPGSSFEVEIDGRTSRIHYAIALRGETDERTYEFSIEQNTSNGWVPVSSERLDGQNVGWQDHTIDLSASPGATRRLRFSTGPPVPGTDKPAELFWGSVAFAAREDTLVESDAESLPDPPNVILLSLDTLGAGYLDYFEHGPSASSQIEAFLDDSFAFRRAYAQYPNTLVSHASLFSGLYPLHHGVYPGTYKRLHSLVDTLAQHGYLTAAFSENGYVSSHFGFANGFDRYSNGRTLDRFEGDAKKTFEDATAWLAKLGSDSRFFLFVHTYEVHAPYVPRDEEALAASKRLTPNNDRIFDESVLTGHNDGTRRLNKTGLDRLRALYIGEIQYLDRLVGEFMQNLRALGIENDTLIILTSDHGEQFGEGGKVGHGHDLHNIVLHVPLGFRWPGRFENAESQNPVQLVDVMPTVLELAGIAQPDRVDGQSLAMTLLADPEASPERPVFTELISSSSECMIHTGASSCRLGRFAVQTGNFKLITSEIPRRKRLYDLIEDPEETRDVSRQFPEEVAKHEALLARYLGSSQSQPHTTDHDSPDLDSEMRERLKALGYIE